VLAVVHATHARFVLQPCVPEQIGQVAVPPQPSASCFPQPSGAVPQRSFDLRNTMRKRNVTKDQLVPLVITVDHAASEDVASFRSL
jgi:hypothetical protein